MPFIIAKFSHSDDNEAIWQLPIAKLQHTEKEECTEELSVEHLMGKLSFTHIIEFLKIDQDAKRRFYELQALSSNLSRIQFEGNF